MLLLQQLYDSRPFCRLPDHLALRCTLECCANTAAEQWHPVCNKNVFHAFPPASTGMKLPALDFREVVPFRSGLLHTFIKKPAWACWRIASKPGHQPQPSVRFPAVAGATPPEGGVDIHDGGNGDCWVICPGV